MRVRKRVSYCVNYRLLFILPPSIQDFPIFVMQQIFFNFDAVPPAREPAQDAATMLRKQRMRMRRAVIKWLLDTTAEDELRPAIGLDVPTRGTMLRVDVGAVWFGTKRIALSDHHSTAVLSPVKTAAIICSTQRQDCWPECSDAEQILGEIAVFKKEVRRLESVIRETEPELRDSDVLFDEYASWNYSRSQNPEYIKTVRRLTQLEISLYKGSRLARIGAGQSANNIILAVPPGIIKPHEVLSSWGILEVNPENMSCQLVKPAENLPVQEELLASFALNIAMSNTRQVMDCNGIRTNEDHTTQFVRMPIFRRKTQS